VRDLGTIDDVLAIASQVDFVRPVLDFAHMHATSDGAYTDVDMFASALDATDAVMERTRRSTSTSATSRTRTQRDEASAVRGGDAARGAATGRAYALRPRRR